MIKVLESFGEIPAGNTKIQTPNTKEAPNLNSKLQRNSKSLKRYGIAGEAMLNFLVLHKPRPRIPRGLGGFGDLQFGAYLAFGVWTLELVVAA